MDTLAKWLLLYTFYTYICLNIRNSLKKLQKSYLIYVK